MTALALATPVDQAEATFIRNSEILRSFRILRLTRICRMAKLVRFFPELQILIKAMLTAFRSVFFALVLLLASHYMVAIAYHVTLKGSAVGSASFDLVLASMQTIFIHCTLLDEVINLVDQFTAEGLYVHLVCMYSVMFINAITLMNLLVGIVVEVISNVAVAEREAVNVKWVEEVLSQLLGHVASVTQSELGVLLHGEAAHQAFELLGVDAEMLRETVRGRFKETPTGELSMTQVVEMVIQLRGTNAATVKDMVELRKWVDRSQQVMTSKLDALLNSQVIAKRPIVRRKLKGPRKDADADRKTLFSDGDADSPSEASLHSRRNSLAEKCTRA